MKQRLAIGLLALVVFMPLPGRSQTPSKSSDATKSGDTTSSSNATSAANNPGAVTYTAEKDVEVATFYMHKGDIDAAILRLQHAIATKPSMAKPHLMLAEAYEKKDMKSQALRYYHEYLSVYPTAPDAKKVQKKIDKLDAEIAAKYDSNH